MAATDYHWGPRLQQEANKCWFYSLIISILLSLTTLFFAKSASKKHTEGTKSGLPEEKTDVSEKPPDDPLPLSSVTQTSAYEQLVIDCCDLFIPGAALAWLPVSPLLVGTASTISTTLAGRHIWKRAQ